MPCEQFRLTVPARFGVRAAINVYLYDSVREVRAAYAEVMEQEDNRTLAFCQNIHETQLGTGRKTQTIANIHIARRRCQLYVLSHELTHAAIGWLLEKPERWSEVVIRQDIATTIEEHACEIQASLLVQLVDALERRGIPVLATL